MACALAHFWCNFRLIPALCYRLHSWPGTDSLNLQGGPLTSPNPAGHIDEYCCHRRSNEEKDAQDSPDLRDRKIAGNLNDIVAAREEYNQHQCKQRAAKSRLDGCLVRKFQHVMRLVVVHRPSFKIRIEVQRQEN